MIKIVFKNVEASRVHKLKNKIGKWKCRKILILPKYFSTNIKVPVSSVFNFDPRFLYSFLGQHKFKLFLLICELK